MPKTPEEPRELKSPRDIMLEKGLQHDDSPTNEPDVNVAANGDMNVTYPERFLRFNVTSISKQRRKFDAFVSVMFKPVPDLPARRLNANTHVDLSSISSKESLARLLNRLRKEEWAAMIEQVAVAVQENWQPGEAAVLLADVPDPGEIQYLVKSLLQVDEHTVVFGPGGSGKSITVLAIGLSVASEVTFVPKLAPQRQGPVLYLDWERSSGPHRLRYSQLRAAFGMDEVRNFHYKRMVGSLADSAEDIKHYVGEHGIMLCISDSVGMAVGGEISDEPAVMGYFNAARYIGGTWLSIAHVPKGEGNGKPIGSQYWYTQPQGGTYEVQGDTPEGSQILSLTMIHQKTNDERNATLGWNVRFADGMVRYANADPMDTATDVGKIPNHRRIAAVLTGYDDLTVSEIVEKAGLPRIDASIATNELKRQGHLFVMIGTGRPQRWAVLDKLQRELSDNSRQLSTNTGGEIVRGTPIGSPIDDNSPGSGGGNETELPPTSDLWYLDD